MIYRIYTENKNKDALLKAIDRYGYPPGYTLFEGEGRYQLNDKSYSEPSLVFEYIGNSEKADDFRVRNLAAFIKRYNNQQEVWIVKIQESERIVV